MKRFVKEIQVILSPEELVRGMESDGVVDVAFTEMDKNHDGKVTEEEFISAIMAKEKISTILTLKIVDILSP